MKKRDLALDFTPLLDVIMIILFVIVSGMGKTASDARNHVQDIEKEYNIIAAELQQNIEENDSLREALVDYENQQVTQTSFGTDVIFVSMGNIKQSSGRHILNIRIDGIENSSESIVLGTDLIENTKDRITSYMENISKNEEGKLIYVVYNSRKKEIYSREYGAIKAALEGVQNTYNNVFVKIVTEE